MDPSTLNAQSQQWYQNAISGYQAAADQYGKQWSDVSGKWNDLYAQQAQFGASQKLAIQQQYDRNIAQQQQGMLARGLGNTTVLDSGVRGINYDYTNSLMALNDQLFQRQNSIRQAQLGQYGQFAQQQAQLNSAGPALYGQLGMQGQQLAGSLQQQQNQIGASYGLAGMQQQPAYPYQNQATYGGFGSGGGGGGGPSNNMQAMVLQQMQQRQANAYQPDYGYSGAPGMYDVGGDAGYY